MARLTGPAWLLLQESACRYLANAGNILQRTPVCSSLSMLR